MRHKTSYRNAAHIEYVKIPILTHLAGSRGFCSDDFGKNHRDKQALLTPKGLTLAERRLDTAITIFTPHI